MKRHDEDQTNLEELEEIRKEDYEEYLDEPAEEAEAGQPLSHILMVILSVTLLLSTIGAIAWGYTEVQRERKESMTQLTLPSGKEVVLPEEKPVQAKEDEPSLSYDEAIGLMEKPVKRFEEHATKTDELAMEFLEDITKMRTTEWKMDYQSHMKQLRVSYAEIETIANQTESGVFDGYTSMLRDLIEIADVRYEAIAEQDAEKFMHAIQLAKELEKKTETMFE